MSDEQPRNPLHGVTLERMLTELVAKLGWPAMARAVRIRCFENDPSVSSSLKFLRVTPWARTEVETLYLTHLASGPSTSTAHSSGTHFLLLYDVVPDYVERRAPLRDAHLAVAKEAVIRGELLLGGALADPVDGAVLLFRAANREVVEDFARRNPYVIHGLVTAWRVRPWTTVIGTLISQDLTPSVALPRP